MHIGKPESQFWIFLIVTSLRHIGFLSYELYRRRNARSRPYLILGQAHLALIRVLYIVIWVGTGYTLTQKQSSTLWFALGLGILVGGSIIRIVGLRTLGRFYSSSIALYPAQPLVQHGIYGVIRHPLLLGLILELLGMSVVAQRTWMWVAWTAALLTLLWWQLREDALLLRAFGRAAERYQAEVPGMNLISGLWRKLRSA